MAMSSKSARKKSARKYWSACRNAIRTAAESCAKGETKWCNVNIKHAGAKCFRWGGRAAAARRRIR